MDVFLPPSFSLLQFGPLLGVWAKAVPNLGGGYGEHGCLFFLHFPLFLSPYLNLTCGLRRGSPHSWRRVWWAWVSLGCGWPRCSPQYPPSPPGPRWRSLCPKERKKRVSPERDSLTKRGGGGTAVYFTWRITRISFVKLQLKRKSNGTQQLILQLNWNE